MLRPLIATLVLLPAIAHETNAQRRPTNGSIAATESVTLGITAQIGGKSYRWSGAGTCKNMPIASIYNVRAALWQVELAGPDAAQIKQLSLTLWRPKDGSADQLSLSIQTGSKTHRIETGSENRPAGTAIVKLQPKGSGGQFDIKGKDAEGTSLDVSITCPSFAEFRGEAG